MYNLGAKTAEFLINKAADLTGSLRVCGNKPSCCAEEQLQHPGNSPLAQKRNGGGKCAKTRKVTTRNVVETGPGS